MARIRSPRLRAKTAAKTRFQRIRSFFPFRNSQKQIEPHLGLGENLRRGAMLNKKIKV